jgi:DNA-binding transcriptional LysR family regulator
MPSDFEQGLVNPAIPDEERVLSGQFWGELRVFLAVARARSFNRAAEILGSSQPTVSRQVKRLQDLLGCQLIATTSHGVALTEEGRLLADSATEFDERLFALAGGVRRKKGDDEGVVSVSLMDTLAADVVALAVAKFSRLYPRIQLCLKSPSHFGDVRHSSCDVSVVFHPIALDEMASRPLGFLHLTPFVSTGYVKEFGRPEKGAVARHRFLASALFGNQTGEWDQWRISAEKEPSSTSVTIRSLT